MISEWTQRRSVSSLVDTKTESEVDTSWTVHIYSISLFNTNFNGNPNLNANVIQPVKGYIKYEPKMMSDEDVLEYTVQ